MLDYGARAIGAATKKYRAVRYAMLAEEQKAELAKKEKMRAAPKIRKEKQRNNR